MIHIPVHFRKFASIAVYLATLIVSVQSGEECQDELFAELVSLVDITDGNVERDSIISHHTMHNAWSAAKMGILCVKK